MGLHHKSTISNIMCVCVSLHLLSCIDYLLGVFNTEGSYWKEHRRFTISSLRDFGMGKHSLEYKIHEEIEAFSSELKKQDGSAMDLQLLMNMTISNIICSIMFGERFSYDDPEFIRMLEILDTMVEEFANLVIGEKLTILRHLPGDPVKVRFSPHTLPIIGN